MGQRPLPGGAGGTGGGEGAGSALGDPDCQPFPAIVPGEALALLGSALLACLPGPEEAVRCRRDQEAEEAAARWGDVWCIPH